MADDDGSDSFPCLDSFFVDQSYVRKLQTFGSYKVEVLCLQSSSTDYDLTGQLIWPGAQLLNDYLSSHSDRFAHVDAIELGSGVGLTGLLCAHFCRKMVMTDHSDVVLQVLERNIQLQRASASSQHMADVECRKLEWGSKSQHIAIAEAYPGGFDYILAADVCYQQENIPLLLQTVLELMSLRRKGSCIFILAYVSRSMSTDRMVIAEASKLNLNIAEAPGSRRRVSRGAYEGVIYEITRSSGNALLPVPSI